MRRHRSLVVNVCARVLLVVVALALLAGVVLSPLLHATAAGAERVANFDVDLTAYSDGDLDVRETITYDFGSGDRHGIYRKIPLIEDLPGEYHRVWTFNDLEVIQDGKKAKVDTNRNDGVETIKIGDENKTLTGAHVYELTYTIGGAFVATPTGIDLTWDAVGTYWDVPIDQVSVTIAGDPHATPVSCAQGSSGATTACSRDGGAYSASGLLARQGMTVRYAFPAGSITGLGPILEHDVTPAYAFAGSRVGLGSGVLVLLAGFGGVFALWRKRGRDVVYAGQIPGGVPAAGQEAAVRVGADAGATSVAFTPPADVRPAELAMVLTQASSQRGVTATLIDLAIRGYLRIEEVDPDGADRAAGAKPGRKKERRDLDHRLTRLEPRGSLVDYEQTLLEGIFSESPFGIAVADSDDSGADETGSGETGADETGADETGADVVLLSEKKNEFSAVSSVTCKEIENRAMERGWFRRRPSSTKAAWYVLGAVLLAVGIPGAVVGATVAWAALGVAVAAVGAVCLFAAHAMPARTADGSAVRAQGMAFRRYLETAEADQIRFEERQEIFSRYLPYAIAFDLADHWVTTFQESMAAAGTTDGTASWYGAWYVGGGGFGDFNTGLDSFSSGMASAMTSSSDGGSGGGGVGGGGGGGGGGSW